MSGERLPLPSNANEQPHSPNHPMNTSWPGQSQNNDGGQFQGVGHLEPNSSTNANHVQYPDHFNSGAYPYQQPTQQPVPGSSGNVRDPDNSTNANHAHPPYHSNSGTYPYQQPTQQPVQGSFGNVRDFDSSTNANHVHPQQPPVQEPSGIVRDSNNSTNANNELLFSGLLLFEPPAQQTVQELSGNVTARNNSTNANNVLPEDIFSDVYLFQDPAQQAVQGPSGIVEDPNNSTISNHVHDPAQPIPSSCYLQEPTQQPVQGPSEIVRSPNTSSNAIANHEHPHSDSRFCCVEQNEQKLKQAAFSGIVGDFVSSPNANHVLPQLSGPYTPQQPAQHLVQGHSGIVDDFGSSPNANHVVFPQDQFFPEPSISHQPQAVQGQSEIVGYPDSLSNPSYALPQQQFPEPSSVPLLSPVQDPSGIRGDENEKKKRKRDDSSCGSTIHVYPHMTGRPHISPWTFPTANDSDSEWAHVLYHELTSKIDDFKATLPSFIIDGFTGATESNRYCLGAVINVNRTECATNVRNEIGSGIKITRRGLDVDMTVLSAKSVFVQSATHAHALRHDLSTVYKVDSGETMPIFDMEAFEQMLAADMSEGYKYELLSDHCSAKISLVKGYGIHYPRKDIKETTCWVLIKFLEATKRLDEVWNQQAREQARKEVDSR